MMKLTYIFSFSCIAYLLSSCTTPKYQRAKLDIPEQFRNADSPTLSATTEDTASHIASLSYRDFYKDQVLIALLDSAVVKNNDMKVALRLVDIAALGYMQSKWRYAPVINATVGNASISRPSDNSMNGIMASQFMGQSYITDYTTSINISWEADIWGKIKGQKEEALVDYLKTQEVSKALKTRIVAEVATGYYNLLMLDKQLEITKANIVFADSTLMILKKQMELGMINSLAVQQQEVAKDQILKRIPEIERSITLQENALSVLTGSYPGAIERATKLDEIMIAPNWTSGVPAELLGCRPDIRSSELDVRKSIATIHVAKVSMYPALNITAGGGLNALKATNWFNIPGSLFGIAAGSILQPVLNGKQLKTRYKQSKISSEQAEINFKQSILKAVGEVSDALVSIEKLQLQQNIADDMVVKTNELIRNAMILYKYNDATYLDVIIAQSNRLQAELDLAAIKTQRMNAITGLYRSLGGGWK